jgi:hypothetical protein
VVVAAGVPLSRLFTVLLVLACPLMMVFMHRDGHGHGSHGGQPAESDDERLVTKR